MAFDPREMDSQIAGEVKNFDPISHFRNAKDARRADRYSQFAVAAAREAFSQSALDSHSVDPFRSGVIIGSSIGGLNTISQQFRVLYEKGKPTFTFSRSDAAEQYGYWACCN